MADEAVKITLTTEEATLAAAQEESERLSAENRHLKSRVVLLRAFVNRLQAESSEIDFDAMLAEADEQE